MKRLYVDYRLNQIWDFFYVGFSVVVNLSVQQMSTNRLHNARKYTYRCVWLCEALKNLIFLSLSCVFLFFYELQNSPSPLLVSLLMLLSYLWPKLIFLAIEAKKPAMEIERRRMAQWTNIQRDDCLWFRINVIKLDLSDWVHIVQHDIAVSYDFECPSSLSKPAANVC